MILYYRSITYVTLFVWIVGLGVLVNPARAHLQDDPAEAKQIVQRAIEDGDARLISQFSGKYTEVSILGASTLYSRAQTVYILKAFFRDHPPESFSFQHQLRVGKEWYFHGRYWYRGQSKPYRLEMVMRWNGQRYEIKSIRIA